MSVDFLEPADFLEPVEFFADLTEALPAETALLEIDAALVDATRAFLANPAASLAAAIAFAFAFSNY